MGTGAGTTTVVVEIVVEVVVVVAVAVVVAVSVAVVLATVVEITVAVRIAVCVTIKVVVTGFRLPFPPPAFNLCCAPAKRPIKTELSNRKMSAATARNLASGLRGSRAAAETRSKKPGRCCSGGVSSGWDTS